MGFECPYSTAWELVTILFLSCCVDNLHFCSVSEAVVALTLPLLFGGISQIICVLSLTEAKITHPIILIGTSQILSSIVSS